jgi:hypothetical protein
MEVRLRCTILSFIAMFPVRTFDLSAQTFTVGRNVSMSTGPVRFTSVTLIVASDARKEPTARVDGSADYRVDMSYPQSIMKKLRPNHIRRKTTQTLFPGVNGYSCDWSPSGDWIVYTDSDSISGRLWLIRNDGSENRQLTF